VNRLHIVWMAVFLSSAANLPADDGGYGVRAFVEPGCELTPVNGKAALLSGLRLGVMLSPSFSIGMEGYRMAKDMQTDQPGIHGNPVRLNTRYGGLVLEYMHRPEKRLHGTVRFLFGGGLAEFRERGFDLESVDDGFWLIYGNIGFELNLTAWLRLSSNIGERFVNGIETANFGNGDIGGVHVTAGLKLGKY
jgi:hypothetical protein